MSNGARQESITTFRTVTVQSSVTRPADTTAYTAGQVVDAAAGGGLTFEKALRNLGQPAFTGQISAAICTSSANKSTLPDLELWLFSEAPAAMEGNQDFDPSDAELAAVVAVVAFPQASWLVANSAADAGGNAICLADPRRVVKGSSDSLFGVLVIRNAYTPVASEVFTVTLHITQD